MRTSLLSPSHTPFDRLTSILLRVLSLVAVVGLLVVVLHSLPGDRSKAASVPAPQVARPADPVRPGQAASAVPQSAAPRVVYAGPTAPPPSPPAGPAASAPLPSPARAEPPPVADAPPSTAAPALASVPARQEPIPASVAATPFAPQATRPAPEAAPPAPPPTRTAAVEAKPEPVRAPAGRLVDLNTASLEELNELNGAGMIGRAVVRGRPYASPEDLLKKRILNRSTYERIKDQITVQ